ncbi:hypothetical protein Q9R19_10370 [Microbacterium sp. ARD32]|nr:hypothetical protein [Microbacterium sp. ARD32]
MQTVFAQKLCAEGSAVDYRAYRGVDHLGLVQPNSPAIADAFAWTEDKLAGTAPHSGCAVGSSTGP